MTRGLQVCLVIRPSDDVSMSIHQPNLVVGAPLPEVFGFEVSVHNECSGVFPTAKPPRDPSDLTAIIIEMN